MGPKLNYIGVIVNLAILYEFKEGQSQSTRERHCLKTFLDFEDMKDFSKKLYCILKDIHMAIPLKVNKCLKTINMLIKVSFRRFLSHCFCIYLYIY